jgi:non-homologous end joining protein Ku
MQTIWKGAINFGLVNVPVKMYTATENNDISMKMLHKEYKQGNYLFDGEVVILDSETGRPNFQRLQHRGKKRDEVQYIIFDLLQVGEEDLREFTSETEINGLLSYLLIGNNPCLSRICSRMGKCYGNG